MGGLILVFLLVVLGTPLLLLIIGAVKMRKDPKTGKILLILAAAWVLVGGGICASLIM
jgi:hypothetical protein